MQKAILFVLFAIICSNSCKMDNKNYVGIYELDTSLSKLGDYEHADSIYDLRLIIKSDSTFEFTKNVPFFYSTTGKWTQIRTESIDNPSSIICHFLFNNMNKGDYDVLLPYDEYPNRIYFKYPLSKRGYNQAEFVCFKRVK